MQKYPWRRQSSYSIGTVAADGTITTTATATLTVLPGTTANRP